MRTQKRFLTLILAVVFLCAMSAAAYAYDVPDLNRKGTINITMNQGDSAVGGGTLTLYHVGAVQEDDGNYGFVFIDDFIDCDVSLEDISSPKLAEGLADYAKEHNVKGVSQSIGEDGKLSFENLELGLYLLVQNKAANGYAAIKPFLVSIPINENGIYVYTVDASPKMELDREPKPDNPVKPSEPSLPQTGQMNWPVPILAVSGMLLFSIGWVLRFGRKRNDYAA